MRHSAGHHGRILRSRRFDLTAITERHIDAFSEQAMKGMIIEDWVLFRRTLNPPDDFTHNLGAGVSGNKSQRILPYLQ